MFIGRTDAEVEAPIFWPPDVKNWLIWKDPDAGKDWRQEKGMTEDEIIGWHHQLSGMSLSKLWELVIDTEAWRSGVHGVPKSQTRLSDWTHWLPEGNSTVNFFRKFHVVVHCSYTILYSQQQCTEFQFLHIFTDTCYFLPLFLLL